MKELCITTCILILVSPAPGLVPIHHDRPNDATKITFIFEWMTIIIINIASFNALDGGIYEIQRIHHKPTHSSLPGIEHNEFVMNYFN